LHNDERLKNPEAAFKSHVFNPIADTAMGQLRSLFEGQRLVYAASTFLYPQSLLQLSVTDLAFTANELQQTN